MEKTHEDPSLQMKESNVLENDEENMNFFLDLLHSQRKKWRPHNRNVLCWSFLCVNDNKKVTFDAPQIMHYILCYSNSFDPKMKLKKGLIFYY
jgi:hypothetical protein